MARDARAGAAQVIDPQSKRLLYGIADRYAALARHVEIQENTQRKLKGQEQWPGKSLGRFDDRNLAVPGELIPA